MVMGSKIGDNWIEELLKNHHSAILGLDTVVDCVRVLLWICVLRGLVGVWVSLYNCSGYCSRKMLNEDFEIYKGISHCFQFCPSTPLLWSLEEAKSVTSSNHD